MLFDCHTHITPTAALGVPAVYPPEVLLREMDKWEIDKAVVLPLESPEAFYVPLPTWYVLEECKKHADRLVPFCTLDPRLERGNLEKEFRQVIQAYLEAGCAGFGEYKPGTPVDDPRSKIVYAACGEFGVACLMHFDNAHNMDELGLPKFEAILREFPEAVFIAHGPGWWREISADVRWDDGYPTRPLVPGGRVGELLDRHSHLYGDLSAGSGFNALNRDREYAREFCRKHWRQLLFGTDLLAPKQEAPIIGLLAELGLSEEQHEAIGHRNLERLLR
jgi:hypothetical protein